MKDGTARSFESNTGATASDKITSKAEPVSFAATNDDARSNRPPVYVTFDKETQRRTIYPLSAALVSLAGAIWHTPHMPRRILLSFSPGAGTGSEWVTITLDNNANEAPHCKLVQMKYGKLYLRRETETDKLRQPDVGKVVPQDSDIQQKLAPILAAIRSGHITERRTELHLV